VSARRRCDHQPRPGTCRTLAGLPADLLNSRHYPVMALCLHCKLVIRSEQFLVSSGRAWAIVPGPF
jgi:hypothetical protein